MNKAFIYLESLDYDNKDFQTIVYKDDGQVLLYDVEDGGVSITETYINDDPPSWKQGYYFVEYTYEMESESWEMSHIQYPVIDGIDWEYCWYGILVRWWIALVFRLTRTHKYHEYKKEDLNILWRIK